MGVEGVEERWTKFLEVSGRRFEVVFIRRPFREGIEVRIDVDGEVISIAELGFGETALLERAKTAIAELLKSK